MKRHALLPLLVCLLLNTAAAETAVSVTAASQAATPTVSTQDLKTLELQFQEKMLDLREKNDKQADELREKTLNAWQNSVSIWLAIMSILGFVIPWLMSLNIKRQIRQEWEDTHAQLKAEADKTRIEFNSVLEEVKQTQADIQQLHQTASKNANEIDNRLQKIKNFNQDKSDSQEQKDAVQAAESLKDNREIPLAEQLRAHAIVLSDKAQSYTEHEQAFYAWQAVIQHSPNDVDALFNAAYQAHEAYEQGNRLQQSVWFPHIEQGYKQVLELNPKHLAARNNLGNALNHEAQALAQNKRFDEAWKKWDEAYKQYKEALRVKPVFYQAADNWGVALSHEAQALAQNNHFDEAWKKWDEAYKQYGEALRFKDDYYQAACNWGVTLDNEARALAQNKHFDEAWDKWNQAYKQYGEALRFKDDYYQAACNWGIALSHEAQALAQNNHFDEAREKWDEAYTQYNNALRIKTDYYQAAYNWGLALDNEAQALAQNNHLDEARDKWDEAYKQYGEALRFKDDYYQAACNWGIALSHEAQALAQNNYFDEARDKWDEAYKQYNNALRIKTDYYQAADNCISSLIHTYHARKQNQQDQTAQAKLAEAQNLAEGFTQHYPQHAAYLAYNLACIYALSGSSADKVVEQLKLSVSADNFPSKNHIEQDKDLDTIRHSPAFQNWFKQTFPEYS